ncbi:hypothetical protein [Paenibacillus macquariensis]|uniref:Lipoprotein n=1 Tax=Paenibacillus macquariensis TaxID=948756 RepID=A0ABY1JKA9_9BACL|nr:hypothetical protein [Paenibacillus macquariensis]MEC0089835.1 hypothetical protein [Paenibacillus macquariensis]OAB30698.1 hypothetical protein PMSM_21375 [Paenibacillus macquariensis subsp. macquariensis]SIQ32289.1 hypothetical protein SAMN05421578_101215 [Paenibacillus macquariensis]
MNKISKVLSLAFIALILLAGCSNKNTAIKDESPATTKVESPAPVATEPVTSTETKESENPAADMWKVYDNVSWTDDFDGLKTTIKKIAVSDKSPKADNPTDMTASVVGVKFSIENTTADTYTTYPDQAVLVTSTGEQIDSPAMLASSNLGGEIYEGVIKEGDVIWYLDRGHAEDIKWVKLKWYVLKGEGMGGGERKEYDVKIELK